MLLLRQQLGLLDEQESLGLVEGRQRQAAERVVGGKTQDQEGRGDIQRADENAARGDGNMEIALEPGRANRPVCVEFRPRAALALEHQRRAVLVGEPTGNDDAIGAPRGVQHVDRHVVEPLERLQLRELHLHVPRAEICLLDGALLKLNDAQHDIDDRRRENRDAGRDDAEVSDQGPRRARALRESRVGTKNSGAGCGPGIRRSQPQPSANISNKNRAAHTRVPPTKRCTDPMDE